MEIETLAKKSIETINKGNFIFICGNGGSAAESQHFAAELVGRYKLDRRALPVIALTTDTSIITAIANDFGYENVFVRQLEALGRPGDILIALSTSGRSENVLRALEWAKEHGMVAIDFERVGDSTSEIQENQLVALHELAGLIERYFANERES